MAGPELTRAVSRRSVAASCLAVAAGIAAAACAAPADPDPSRATAAASASDRTPDASGSPLRGPASPAGTDPPATPSQSLVSVSHPAGPWTALSSAPAALTEVAAAAFEGRVWVVGGLDAGGQPSARVMRYDPDADAWDDGPPLPVPIHHATLVAAEDGLYVMGGFTAPYGPGDLAPTEAVWRIANPGGTWEAGPALPGARGAGAATWDGARLLFGGGVGPAGVAGDVWALEEGEWSHVGSLSLARQHLAATSDGRGEAWFLGGRIVSLAQNVGIVDAVEGGVVRRLPAVIEPRSGLGAFWAPSGACAAGGETPGGTVTTVQCVDADSAVTDLPPLGVARHGVGAAALDGVAYVMLGGREPGLYVSETAEALTLGP